MIEAGAVLVGRKRGAGTGRVHRYDQHQSNENVAAYETPHVAHFSYVRYPREVRTLRNCTRTARAPYSRVASGLSPSASARSRISPARSSTASGVWNNIPTTNTTTAPISANHVNATFGMYAGRR